jgi:protein-disulfide isomerase
VSSVAEIVEPLDHIRGTRGGHLLLVYGDYECPYTAAAYRAIQHVERDVDFQFVFRHFPLMDIHPHALAGSAAAEAASLQGRFWEMHDWLFQHQKTLADEDLRAAADALGLAVDGFDSDRASPPVLERIQRDLLSGDATGEVLGTPTLFIDGTVCRGSYDARRLREVLAT